MLYENMGDTKSDHRNKVATYLGSVRCSIKGVKIHPLIFCVFQVAVVTALGTGIVIGAGVAYLYTRFHEHAHLVQQITNLHVSILEVLKKDLTSTHAGKVDVCYQTTTAVSCVTKMRLNI